VTISTDYDTDS